MVSAVAVRHAWEASSDNLVRNGDTVGPELPTLELDVNQPSDCAAPTPRALSQGMSHLRLR